LITDVLVQQIKKLSSHTKKEKKIEDVYFLLESNRSEGYIYIYSPLIYQKLAQNCRIDTNADQSRPETQTPPSMRADFQL
jgi:hypothetical protein